MITVTGRVISKKNNHAGGGRFFITSKAYKEFETATLWQLKKVREVYSEEVSIRLSFQMKGRLDTDLDNMVTSIIDVLQKAGIIVNDKKIVEINAEKTHGHSDFLTIINITKPQ